MKKILTLSLLAAMQLGVIAAASAQTVSKTALTLSGVNIRAVGQSAVSPSYFANDGRTLLVIDNRQTSGVVTATLVAQITNMQTSFGGLIVGSQEVTVPSNSVVIVGPFNERRFNAPTGLMRVNLTSTSLVSVSTVAVPR